MAGRFVPKSSTIQKCESWQDSKIAIYICLRLLLR